MPEKKSAIMSRKATPKTSPMTPLAAKNPVTDCSNTTLIMTPIVTTTITRRTKSFNSRGIAYPKRCSMSTGQTTKSIQRMINHANASHKQVPITYRPIAMLRRMRSELTCKIKVSQNSAGIRNTSKKNMGTPSCFRVSLLMVYQPFLCRQGDGQVVNHQEIPRLVSGIIQKKGFRQQEPRSCADQYF